jgi:hypothetical protein
VAARDRRIGVPPAAPVADPALQHAVGAQRRLQPDRPGPPGRVCVVDGVGDRVPHGQLQRHAVALGRVEGVEPLVEADPQLPDVRAGGSRLQVQRRDGGGQAVGGQAGDVVGVAGAGQQSPVSWQTRSTVVRAACSGRARLAAASAATVASSPCRRRGCGSGARSAHRCSAAPARGSALEEIVQNTVAATAAATVRVRRHDRALTRLHDDESLSVECELRGFATATAKK